MVSIEDEIAQFVEEWIADRQLSRRKAAFLYVFFQRLKRAMVLRALVRQLDQSQIVPPYMFAGLRDTGPTDLPRLIYTKTDNRREQWVWGSWIVGPDNVPRPPELSPLELCASAAIRQAINPSMWPSAEAQLMANATAGGRCR